MRVAFYAPMKPPDHPTPSGDRTMARLLMAALARGGHEVTLAARLRSWDGRGDARRQARLAGLGERLAARLVRRWRAAPRRQPELWLTYHLHHKAPDWVGPRAAAALGIPYVLAEASYAAKRRVGPWALGNEAVAAAIAAAEAVIGLNEADREGVAPLLADPARWVSFKPFLDAAPWREAGAARERHRALLADAHGLDPARPWLVATGMMRAGDKLRSYEVLAAALARLLGENWHLLVVGDGAARPQVEAALAPLAGRAAWLGRKEPADLAAVLAASDIFVWPAINEAYGMALLEAQAAGLPAVAGASGGVPGILCDGVTGRLAPPDDPAAFAEGLLPLLRDAGLRRRWGEAAAARIAAEHDLGAAARQLDAVLRRLAPATVS
jgi:glycosyltransferase involved in cell wall biosynthesis